MRKYLAVLVLFVFLAGAGCTHIKPVTLEYVQADVEFDSVLGDRIVAYIDSDPALSPTERDAMQLAVQAWRAMVARAAAQNGILVGGPEEAQ